MSNKNWTPGPWKAHNNGPHWNNKEIDNWEIHWSDIGECVVDHVYEEPDAHLIAAAPKLYDALEALHSWCRENLTPGQLKEAVQLGLDAQSAMAEARGEGE